MDINIFFARICAALATLGYARTFGPTNLLEIRDSQNLAKLGLGAQLLI